MLGPVRPGRLVEDRRDSREYHQFTGRGNRRCRLCLRMGLVRERERKDGALADRAAGFDRAVMFMDDLVDDGQAQSGADMLRAFVFRGEKWVEDVGEILGGNSAAGIRDLDLNPSRSVESGQVTRHDRQSPARCLHGIHGVQDQIHQDLLHLLAIDHDRIQRFFQLFLDGHAQRRRLYVDEVQAGGNDLIQRFQ